MEGQEEFENVYSSVCEREGWTFSRSQVDVKFDDGRHQSIQLEFFEHEGHGRVRCYTTIGGTARITTAKLTNALSLNFKLPHGALATRGENLVLVETMSVEDADVGEVEGALRYLAEMGDHLERTMFGPDRY